MTYTVHAGNVVRGGIQDQRYTHPATRPGFLSAQ